MSTPSATTEIPAGFWAQIDHQLERLRTGRTFDEVREVLLDPAYDEIQKDIHLNGQRVFDTDSAFFAGSGGETSLRQALFHAGWDPIAAKASYYYVLRHPTTGETLTYIEGDVQRGDRMSQESA